MKVVVVPCSDGRSLYVEVEEATVSSVQAAIAGELPEGAEPVSVRDRVVDALQALKDNISTVARAVHSSLSDCPPEEWTLELNIGFKGTLTPIPVILSGNTQGAIKVIAKWKKPTADS